MGQGLPVEDELRLSPAEALHLIEEHARQAQAELAERTEAGADVLHFLALNGAAATRRAVAANQGASAKTNRTLADDVDDEVRTTLARKIAKLLPGLLLVEQDHVAALTLATLERLARDETVRVRAMLSEEIKLLDCVPREIVLLLARDVEQVVASPILEYSPLLSEKDLLEVIANGQARTALAAIARRRKLPPRATEAIARSLNVPAVAALLANTDASLRKATLDKIISHAAQVKEWHGALALRPELSNGMIARLAAFVGVSLIELMARRRGLDRATKAKLAKRLSERLAVNDEEASPEPIRPQNEVQAALGLGKLDDEFFENAAASGQRETIIQGLAHLAGARREDVRKIVESGSARPLTALVWRAKLSMRTAFKIQSLVMRLKGSDLLPARRGTDFPMGEDEMRWHLSYFGIKG